MKLKWIAYAGASLSVVALWIAIAKGQASPANRIPPVTAVPVRAFLASIGVNSSISKRGESLEKTRDALLYTGISWIRTGYEGEVPVEDLITLHRQTGVRFSYGLLSGGTDIARLLSGGKKIAAAGALLAFEGPNEPNNWGIVYKGEKGGRDESWLPVARLQRDLYAAVKADPVLKEYPVWSLSENGAQTDHTGLQFLEIPKGAPTLLPAGTRFADFANCHNYIVHPGWPGLHDNQTWIAASPGFDSRVDGLAGNYGITWAKQFKGYTAVQLETLPRVTTETGLTMGPGITETQHAALLLNMYLAQFKRGWSYTAVYLLRDRSDEAGNQQFGFYRPDYTPRAAAIYLHNMTTILEDRVAPKNRLRPFAYRIQDSIPTVHDLLLQRSDGTYYLVVWGEKLKGSDAVTIRFNGKQRQLDIYDPAVGTQAVRVVKNTAEVQLVLSDHPLIIAIKSLE
ncbi:hypothetical protein SAMN04487894_107139 [Niabella drilacis]|uniref:Glycosyl hydrolase n=2 Tax=Niabella drilacis (strain DSM 25811 / CCM 8410 / CCUG 62505 / LMG 26954 / E90) TaxID=1285928 RepID=A0A1G6T981_NIADE|nr:hypothetical protein SAMN04487894_107139 [Niabella drilacis]